MLESSKTRSLVIGTVLSTVASWYGGYLFASPVAALGLLAGALLLFIGGNLAIGRYHASGKRQSRPVPLGRGADRRPR